MNAVVNISFFQDIEVPSVEGEIVCSDVALYNLLPFAFGDKIRIFTMSTKYNSEKKEFTIDKEVFVEFRVVTASMTSPEPGVQDKDNFKTFSISIMDDNGFDGYLTRRSARFFDSIGGIVKSVLSPVWKPLNKVKIDPKISSDKYEITLPSWSVFHQLKYLSKFTEFSDGSGCVFFPTLPVFRVDGHSDYEFHYTSLSALMKNAESFIQEEYSLTGDINRIYNVYLEKDSNNFELINNGVDINSQKIWEVRRTKLHKYLAMGSEVESTKYRQTRLESFPTVNYTDNYLIKNLMNQVSLWCTVVGDFKRKVGTVIDVKFPSGHDAHNKKDYFDKKHSGKYLIRSMEHLFTKDKDNQWFYNQKLGLVADGYSDDEFKTYKKN